jgi:FkbM family methyltransferase
MTKVIFLLARFLRKITPSLALHIILRAMRDVPMIGKRMIAVFDPNNIRKKVGHSARPKLVALKDNNWSMMVNINDHIGYYSFINRVPFEMAVYEIGQKLELREGDIVLDIGANIGSASVPICASTGAELIAIEASKENTILLAQNILDNNIKSQIHIFALTNSTLEPYIEFYVQRGNTGTNSIFQGWNPGLTQQKHVEFVPTMTLDKICANSSVDLDKIKVVKMDVEGAEELVLLGASDFLKSNTAPIILEYRRDAAQKFRGDDLSGLLSLLTTNEYEVHSLHPSDYTLQPFDPKQSYENIIAIKTQSLAAKALA